MGYSYSEDNGKSWSKVKSLGKPCVMAFTSIVRLNNGDYMGFYHRGYKDRDQSPLTLWSAISHDGGITWNESVKIAEVKTFTLRTLCLSSSEWKTVSLYCP